jgi:branched-chain amino acid transport system permease protein
VKIILLSGFFVGLVYGLVAVGLVVIYRGSRVISFCYGETGMFAAMLFADLWTGKARHFPLGVALPLGVLIAAAIGAATELILVRRLRDEPRLTVIIGTFGISAFLLVLAGRRWGSNARSLGPLVRGIGPKVFGLRIAPEQLLILGVCAVVLVGLHVLYNHTALGLRMRATAIDPYAAGQVGVNTNLTSLASWSLAGAIAGASAILIAPLVGFSIFFMTALAIRGLAAALVGGLTNTVAAFVTGVLFGLFEALAGYLNKTPGLVDFGLAVFIIGLLMVRPGGLVRGEY